MGIQTLPPIVESITAAPVAATPIPARQPIVDAFRAEVVRLMNLPGVGPFLTAYTWSWFVGENEDYKVTQHSQTIDIVRCVGLHVEDKQTFSVAMTQAAFECELYAARKVVREALQVPIGPIPNKPAVNTCRALVPLADTPQLVWARWFERNRARVLQSIPEGWMTRQGVTYATR